MLGGWLASTVVGAAVGASVVLVVVVVGGDVVDVADDVEVTATAAVVDGSDESGGSDTRSAEPAVLPHAAMNASTATSHA